MLRRAGFHLSNGQGTAVRPYIDSDEITTTTAAPASFRDNQTDLFSAEPHLSFVDTKIKDLRLAREDARYNLLCMNSHLIQHKLKHQEHPSQWQRQSRMKTNILMHF